MYAVIGRVEIDSSRADEAAELLNNYTVPMVKQAPVSSAGRGRGPRTERADRASSSLRAKKRRKPRQKGPRRDHRQAHR